MLLVVRLAAVLLSSLALVSCPLTDESPGAHLRIDQFGYRPGAIKTAILREPVIGFDAPTIRGEPSFGHDAKRPLEIVDTSGRAVLSGTAQPWHHGAIHGQSGDRVWWFDFSALETPGSYRVRDPLSGEVSEEFVIAAEVYDDVLRQALRMFYQQRCGTAKTAPYSAPPWSDEACHLGPGLSDQARLIGESLTDDSTVRELSGGWHDAGDDNLYVNFADDALHSLLEAYSRQPAIWDDELGIPESGNGLADILDELAWEFTWLLKMQLSDGSVLHKLSVSDWSMASPPSADRAPRFYAPATASATISAAGACAHGARVFATVDQPIAQALATRLRAAALAAWDWLEAHPAAIPSRYDNAGFLSADAEDTPDGQLRNRVRAAEQLFALTGEARFREAVDAYAAAEPYAVQLGEALVWEQPLVTALLEYGELPGATRAIAERWREQFAAVLDGPAWMAPLSETRDAYRAWLPQTFTTWGSNRVRAMGALLRLDRVRFGASLPGGKPHTEQQLAAAEDVLHSFHGVNPLGLSYLTNMGAYGAAGSVSHMYHSWFAGAAVVPPPGYLTGGPNRDYAPDPSVDAATRSSTLSPPLGQPALKSYRDWNAGWPENSWALTECQLRYQASYIELLAHCVSRSSPTRSTSSSR